VRELTFEQISHRRIRMASSGITCLADGDSDLASLFPCAIDGYDVRLDGDMVGSVRRVVEQLLFMIRHVNLISIDDYVNITVLIVIYIMVILCYFALLYVNHL